MMWASPARPGIVWLRPLDLGEILGGAFRLLRFNPKATVGFSFVLQLIGLALAVPLLGLFLNELSGSFSADDTSLEADLDPGVSYLGNLQQIPSALLTAAAAFILCVVVSRAVLGEKITVRQAWAHAKPSVWRYLGLQLLFLLASGIVIAACVGLCIVLLPLGVALTLAAVVAFVLLTVRLGFAATALVLERLSIADALRRSWALTGGQFWRLLGIRILAGLITSMVSSVIAMPVMLLAMAVGVATVTSADADLTPLLIAVVGAAAVAGAIGGALSTPLSSAVDTLLYLDQRMRREGLDLRLAAVVAERAPQER